MNTVNRFRKGLERFRGYVEKAGRVAIAVARVPLSCAVNSEEIGPEIVNSEVSLCVVPLVTFDAMSLKKRLDCLLVDAW